MYQTKEYNILMELGIIENLQKLQQSLKESKDLCGKTRIEISVRIKFITFIMCVRKNFHFPHELLEIIFEMINFIKFLKSDQTFGKEICFRVHLDRRFVFPYFNNARINKLVNLYCVFYMIIDLDRDSETFTCIELECRNVKDPLWEIYIDPTSSITIFTFEELYCESAVFYDDISDFDISSPHCKIIKYTK
jgi:hypothetical protein